MRWSDFHFHSLKRVQLVFPRSPHDALPSVDQRARIGDVRAIQVAVFACIVPPCAFLVLGAVPSDVIVIILVASGPNLSVVVLQGIACGR